MRIEEVNECKRCCECGEYITISIGGENYLDECSIRYLDGYSIRFEHNTEVSVTLCKPCMIDLIADFGPIALKKRMVNNEDSETFSNSSLSD